MSKIGVFLAEGFEEIEGLTVVDILRRANIETVTIAIGGKRQVMGSHGIHVVADCVYEDMAFEELTGIVLPGGMPGTTHLKEHAGVVARVQEFARAGKLVAAICAAPGVLGDLGILKGKKAVCYPGFEERLHGANVAYDKVAVDGNVTTSRGMGTAIPFALALVEQLVSKEKAEELKKGIIYGHA